MYRIGVVGCGTIGTRLAETFAAHDRTTVWGACDVDADRAESFAADYGAAAFTDHERLVERDAVDAVYVGVPPTAHVEVATDALAAGKHVLCEKPLAETADAGERLVAAERASDRVTGVNLPFRYTPGFRELRDRVLAGELGEIRRIDLHFRFPQWPREWQDVSWLESREQGGPTREVGTHFLFGVQELFGPIDRVDATVQYAGPDLYEQSVVGSFTVDGVQGTYDLATDHAASEENSITVLGEDGELSLTDWYRLIADRGEETERVLVDERTATTELLVDEFVAAMDDPTTGDLVSFAEANQVQRVVDAIFASDGDPLDVPADPDLRSPPE